MPHPELYKWYPIEEAISFFGAHDGARSFCNGQWLVFRTALVCLTEIDETNTRNEPTKSHFKDASRFCWVADQSYRGPDGEPHYFLPAEAISGVKGRWAYERTTLSEHLILACLFGAITCHAKYGAWVSWLDEDTSRRSHKGFLRWLSDHGDGWLQVFSAATACLCMQRQTAK